jgi:hypothetical protein
MSSILQNGDAFHGISVFGRGVFTNAEHGETYAGQCKDGYACGLGVLTCSGGSKEYAEHGPDGQCEGRYLERDADGSTDYFLWERGKAKEYARVFADGGTCEYNGVACVPDDPRLLALIAQVAPVEVRSAARAPHPPLAAHSPPSNRPMDRPACFPPRRRWRPPWPPRCTPIHCRWCLRDTTQQQPHCKARPHSDACTGLSRSALTRGAYPLAP